MTIKATIVGMEKLVRALREVEGEADQAMVTALQAGALVIQNKWKRNIVAMGAVDTGTYLRSVHTEVTSRKPPEVTIGSDITDPPYPEYVERGTRRMAPRPAARQAIDTSEAEVMMEVTDALKEVFGRYGV
jgi:HK97 gp10 family phage protein